MMEEADPPGLIISLRLYPVRIILDTIAQYDESYLSLNNNYINIY
jgi:hypothetical protein